MAFQAPQHRPQANRASQPVHVDQQLDISTSSQQAHTKKRPLEDSEEWVLFSPQPPSVTDRTHTTSTDRTPRTHGLSLRSDFGSLDTRADSGFREAQYSDHITELGEDAELDSLDDGLHAFHEPSDYGGARQRLDTSGAATMPTHDGLGTFEPSSNVVQNQLWQFERYNPRRPRHRRRSSAQSQLEQIAEAEGHCDMSDKTRRIEKWRVEQSIALLEEIERETRRMRRLGRAGVRPQSRASSAAVRSEAAASSAATATEMQETVTEEAEEQESWWTHFTQRVIRNLMGIDESILSVIFGEELPEEAKTESSSRLSAADMVREAEMHDAGDAQSDPWEHRLLERISRELGQLVHQLSEHPGAFGTYLRTQDMPSYVGFDPAVTNRKERLNTERPQLSRASTMPGSFPAGSTPAGVGSTNIHFDPTVPQERSRSAKKSVPYSEASLWGIEEEDPDDEVDNAALSGLLDEAARLRHEKDYWERELDVKMVFDFLKKRFSRGGTSLSVPAAHPINVAPAATGPHAQSSVATATAVQHQRSRSTASLTTVARRAALIRKHHPLVSSAAATASESLLKARRLREHMHRQSLQLQSYGIPQHMRAGSGGRFSASRSVSGSVVSVSAASGVSVVSRSSGGGGGGGTRARRSSGSSRRSGGAGGIGALGAVNFWDGKSAAGGGAGSALGSVVGSASGVGPWGEV